MKENSRGLLYVILFSLFWAIDVIISKLAFLKGAQPFVFSYQSFALSAIFLFFYMAFFLKKSKKPMIHSKDIFLMLFFGVIANGVGQIAGVTGLNLSTASNYGFLIKTTVVFVMLLSFFFLKEKISLKKLFFLALLLSGAYLISTKGTALVPHIGDLFIIIAALGYALVTVFSKKIIHRNSPEYLSFYRVIGGGLAMLIVSIAMRLEFFDFTYIYYVVADSIAVSLLYIFLYKAIEIKSASYFSMVSMLFSVIVAIFSYFVFGEMMKPVQIIGGILIIGSVIMIEKTKA